MILRSGGGGGGGGGNDMGGCYCAIYVGASIVLIPALF